MDAFPLLRTLKVAVLTASLVAGSAYANCQCGTLIAKKFYDANANGVRDAGEPALAQWRMTTSSASRGFHSTRYTNVYGNAVFGVLAANDYVVLEGTPVQGNWVQTAPRDGAGNPVNPLAGISVVAGQTTRVSFGNYCTIAGGGRTPGFWSNRNGFNTLMDGSSYLPELALLSGLHLRDANGLDFDPADYGQFRTWLLGGTATNMAYMLSVHLAAMRLNVEAGLVDGTRVYAPFGGTINELIALADASLAANPITFASHPERAYQARLKGYLDQLNNGAAVVSPTPCAYSF
jgi:hypothetical protein